MDPRTRQKGKVIPIALKRRESEFKPSVGTHPLEALLKGQVFLQTQPLIVITPGPDVARFRHGRSILLMGVTVKVDQVDQIRPAGSYHQQLRRDCYAEEPASQEDKPETFRRIIARFCCSSDPARRPASIPRMSYQRQLAGAAHGLHFHRAESPEWPRGLRRVLRGPGLPGNQVRLRPSRYLFSGV